MKKYWKQILFFGAILGVYIAGVAPDMTYVSMAGDMFWWVPCAQNMWAAPLGGYPTYIMLGWIFERLPSNEFWNLGLLSALSAVGTCIFIYLIIGHLVRPSSIIGVWGKMSEGMTLMEGRQGSGMGLASASMVYRLKQQEKQKFAGGWASYIGAATCAGAFIFWTQAVVPEVYTFTILLAVAMTYAVLTKHYYIAAGIGALGLGTHHLIGFAIIPLLGYVYYKNRSKKQMIKLVGIGSLGLLAYLQTYLGHGPWATPAASNLRGLGLVGGLPIGMTLDKVKDFVPVIVVSIGTGLALLPFLKKSPEVILIGVIAVGSAAHYFFSNVAGWTPYLAFPVAFIAILVGLGVEHFPYKKLVLVFLLAPLIMMGVNFQTYDIGRTIDPEPMVFREAHSQVVEYSKTIGLEPDTLLITTLDVESMTCYYLRFNEQTFNHLPIGFIWWKGDNQDNCRRDLLNEGILLPEDLGPYGENTGWWDHEAFLQEMCRLNPTIDIYFGTSEGTCDDKESSISLISGR